MPIYLFENPETGEVKEIFLKIGQEKRYSEGGVAWHRKFTVPNASTDTSIPLTQDEWNRRTENKKVTVGDLWDLSNESSKKREASLGKDPVKEKYYKNYSKVRNGLKHPKQKSDGY